MCTLFLMRMPHEKLLVVATCFPVAIIGAVLVLDLFDWLNAPVGLQEPNITSVQHLNYQPLTTRAVEAFGALPEDEQKSLKQALTEAVQVPSEWLGAINQRDLLLVCLGEDHTEATRFVLAHTVLPMLSFDDLMIEATGANVAQYDKALRKADTHIPLLGADISAVLRAALNHSPGHRVIGIEETPEQMDQRANNGPQFREDSIEANYTSARNPKHRTVVLFGANHCRDEPSWLFGRVTGANSPTRSSALSIRILPDHYDGPTEAFVNFLIAIGVLPADVEDQRSFVIHGRSSLPPLVQDWFGVFVQNRLDVFDAVLIYRNAEIMRAFQSQNPSL